MIITPKTNLYLLKCPLESDNKNQLTFTDLNEQLTYFESLPHFEATNFTYQRKDNIIRFPADYDSVLNYNYVMYQNESYSNKWFFAFIVDMRYSSNGMTEITIKTDVYQTWHFEMNFKTSFVEREHVNDDTIGLHTVPENLETGDYLMIDEYNLEYDSGFYTCCGLSDDILTSDTPQKFYNGVVSGLTYIVLKDKLDVNRLITRYNKESKIDAIYSLFMIPAGYISNPIWKQDTTGLINFAYIPSTDTNYELGEINIGRPSRLGISDTGYLPKNNKMLTYPYIYILADNNCGSNIIYNYEYFSNPLLCNFKAIGSISAGCNIKLVPSNYKSITSNYAESFNAAKLPVGSWTNDVYTNWLTQNSVNVGIGLVSSAMQIGSGALMLGTGAGSLQGASNIASGSLNIASSLGSIYQHSLAPNQAEGNVNSSDVMFSAGRIAPTFYRMTIKEEYAKIIDDYFTLYGYKVNSLKIPNIRGRRNWNFVRTIGANIEGNIPQSDIEELKQIFNAGVTLWHHANTYLDYSQNNGII